MHKESEREKRRSLKVSDLSQGQRRTHTMHESLMHARSEMVGCRSLPEFMLAFFFFFFYSAKIKFDLKHSKLPRRF